MQGCHILHEKRDLAVWVLEMRMCHAECMNLGQIHRASFTGVLCHHASVPGVCRSQREKQMRHADCTNLVRINRASLTCMLYHQSPFPDECSGLRCCETPEMPSTCGTEGAAHLAADLRGDTQRRPLLAQHSVPILTLTISTCASWHRTL